MQSTFAKEEEVADCLTVLRSICKQMVQDGFGQPTAFEIETVMAFMLFEKWNVDIAIVECGLGGRMDATIFLSILIYVCLLQSVKIIWEYWEIQKKRLQKKIQDHKEEYNRCIIKAGF